MTRAKEQSKAHGVLNNSERRPKKGDEGKKVGIIRSGSLTDTIEEGVIESIGDSGLVVVHWNTGETSLPMSPLNLVLIDAEANNASSGVHGSDVAGRLNSLIIKLRSKLKP